MDNKKLTVIDAGLIGYEEALYLQMKIHRLVSHGKLGHVLLILEHFPVITLGSGANAQNILADPGLLRAKGVSVFQSNRGGDVTYHGPGQIVGYPVIDLKRLDKDVKEHVRKLEEVTIRLLKSEYGIDAERIPGLPGVWVGNEKITAIGCAVKRWVTWHGFAFNLNTDMIGFSLIHPCGILDRGVTSLEKLIGTRLDMQRNKNFFIRYFCDVYGLDGETANLQTFLDRVKELTNECEQAGLA